MKTQRSTGGRAGRFLTSVVGALGFPVFLGFLGLSVYGQTLDQAPARSPFQLPTEDVCPALIAFAEQEKNIPQGLLLALATVESGRPSRRDGLKKPWPWTLNLGGESYFFEDKPQLLAFLEQKTEPEPDDIPETPEEGLLAPTPLGASMDLGCMQLNLAYHGRAFDAYDQIVNPVDNIAYATQFLLVLYDRHGSWRKAIQAYHAGPAERRIRYLRRVLQTWRAQRDNGLAAYYRNFPLERVIAARNTGNTGNTRGAPKQEEVLDTAWTLPADATDFERSVYDLAHRVRQRAGLQTGRPPGQTQPALNARPLVDPEVILRRKESLLGQSGE